MSEIRRGCPTEDGVYVVLYRGLASKPPFEIVVRRANGELRWADGTPFMNSDKLLAHRPHVPLEVPPLKSLHDLKGKRVVVKPNNSVRIYLADKFEFDSGCGVSVRYLVHMPVTHFAPDYIDSDKLAELTRAECEAAGFIYPEGCP